MSDRLDLNTTTRFWKWYIESPGALALTFVSILLTLTLLIVIPTCDTNDDPTMGLAVSGYFTKRNPLLKAYIKQHFGVNVKFPRLLMEEAHFHL